ncbi:BCCT family transporter: glycine betaine/carnitine/choline, partial [Ostreococcus lucimarinus CCE9901]
MATTTLWGFTIGVLSREEAAEEFFGKATLWISNNFTWFYTLTQNAWIFVVIFVLFRKRYANIKLGQPDDRPDYSDLVWFTLIFTTGLGTGIFYFGVSEPMYYYRDDSKLLGTATNYIAKIPFMNDDQRANMAMFVTFLHWGLHGWATYILVALTLGVVHYRLGRPLTLRSAFYPIVGDYVNGLFGDLIDSMSIACTTFGLCTSLGLGASSINTILHRMSASIPDDDDNTKSAIIWGITALTTGALVSGLHRGVITFAIVAFSILLALIMILFMLDNTWYLANSFTQQIGTYLQYVILGGFDNDAIAQLNIDSPTSFMDTWTVFYWAWWITWAPFVGMFYAKISRGRTIRSLILVGMFAPMFLGFFAISVLGSLGIRMQRIAELALGAAPDWQKGVVNCGALGYLENTPPYKNLTTLLQTLVLLGVILFFVTSADAGAFVDDKIAANGMENPPVLQKVWWSITQGATAQALLSSTKNGLSTLQSVSICAALPYTFALNYMCVALFRAMD